MKLQFPFLNASRRKPANGFTLPEILIAMTVFLFVVAGMIAANLYGMRMVQTDQAKLNVSEWTRNSFGRMTEEIHACDNVTVGNFTNGFFLGLLDGETQQGSGLLIYPFANDTNNYILYYINPSDKTFRRATDQTNTAAILAYSVTNITAFSAQDLSGNVLTNNLSNKVIHLTLEIYQPGGFMKDSDYYQLETSIKQ